MSSHDIVGDLGTELTPWGRLVWRVVAHGLPQQPGLLTAGLNRERPDDEPLDAKMWRQLTLAVKRHRVPGLLVAAIADGALPADDRQRLDAHEAHVDACSTVLGLERRLIEVVDLLEDADIEVIALKGSVHAHLLYPDPALRHFGDVDVLVRSERLGDAVQELARHLGAHRQVPELSRGFDRRFAKGVTVRDPAGTEIDVHRTLLFGTYAFRIDLDELFGSAVHLEVGGRRIRALDPETRLLHTSYHAALGDPRPRGNSMRDLAESARFVDLDHDRVVDLAGAWRCEAVLMRAFALQKHLLGQDVSITSPVRFDDYSPTRADRAAINSYVGTRRSHLAKVAATLPFIDSLREKTRFVLGALPMRKRAP